MEKNLKKYKIELNSADNVRDLLQETYQLADEQIIQAQNEINKLANATKLQDEVMDARTKYAKAINDYMGMRDKAIKTKLDIAKLLTEIMTHNGDINKALNDDSSQRKTTFDPKAFQNLIDEVVENRNDKKEIKTIQINKK
jgi:hypothetical protein